jgi:type IV secretion system protein VirD4
MSQQDGPPRLGRSGAETILGCGAAAVAVLALLDVAGALAELLSGAPARLRPLGAMGQVVAILLRYPSRPSLALGRGVPATLFWISATALLGAGGAVAFAVRRALGGMDPGRMGGFASPAEIRAVASLRAARRKAPQTRPSLVAGSRRRFGPLLGPRLPAGEVGYPLGTTRRPSGIALVAHFETSLRLVAPPGEGKTKRVMEPIGRGHPGPLFATSTKSDLYEAIIADRSAIGPVVALDPDALVPGARPLRWSPVAGCESTRTADRRAGALLAAGADMSDVKAGEFFRDSARAVLAALLHAAALGGVTMADVVRWAADPSNPEPARILSRHGAGLVDWSERLARHTTGAEVTTSGVMRTIDVALACFQHDEVLELCSPAPGDELDLTSLLAANGTVFGLGKDRPGGVAPLVTAFAEELVVTAEELAARAPARRLDPPLLCLLDEAPSIAPLPGLPALAADGRGRGIIVVYAMQSFSQAEWRWGTDGAETLANATTVTAVLGGLKVADDLRELSQLCGTRKVLRHTSSSQDGPGGPSVSATWADEAVLEESAVRCLPEGVALVIWGRLRPMLVYLPGSWEGPRAKQLTLAEQAARRANDEARRLVASGGRR